MLGYLHDDDDNDDAPGTVFRNFCNCVICPVSSIITIVQYIPGGTKNSVRNVPTVVHT